LFFFQVNLIFVKVHGKRGVGFGGGFGDGFGDGFVDGFVDDVGGVDKASKVV
jgi:hypothetical protein